VEEGNEAILGDVDEVAQGVAVRVLDEVLALRLGQRLREPRAVLARLHEHADHRQGLPQLLQREREREKLLSQHRNTRRTTRTTQRLV
jgi:metal-dependent hydrolase (beta-lactamase superfamily II)